MVWTLHRRPFHRSAKPLAPDWPSPNEPTAVHASAELQDTALSSVVSVDDAMYGFGIGWAAQDDPFHRAANGTGIPVGPDVVPTAEQNLAPEHATPVRLVPCGTSGLGTACPAHRRADQTAP